VPVLGQWLCLCACLLAHGWISVVTSSSLSRAATLQAPVHRGFSVSAMRVATNFVSACTVRPINEVCSLEQVSNTLLSSPIGHLLYIAARCLVILHSAEVIQVFGIHSLASLSVATLSVRTFAHIHVVPSRPWTQHKIISTLACLRSHEAVLQPVLLRYPIKRRRKNNEKKKAGAACRSGRTSVVESRTRLQIVIQANSFHACCILITASIMNIWPCPLSVRTTPFHLSHLSHAQCSMHRPLWASSWQVVCSAGSESKAKSNTNATRRRVR
jgi:hypothetical protein